MSPDEIKTAINAVLDERDAFPGATHTDHHRFVNDLIERERRKQERRERLRQQVYGWGIITLLSGIGLGAYQLFISFIQKVSNQ